MCNLDSLTRAIEAIRQLFPGLRDHGINLQPLPGIFPDYPAPIIRNASGGPDSTMARWGMPTPPKYLVGKKIDRGVTDILQTTSSHLRGWRGAEHRCLIPFTSFAENKTLADGSRPPVWFAFDESGRHRGGRARGGDHHREPRSNALGTLRSAEQTALEGMRQ